MDTLSPPKSAIQTAVFWTWMGDDGICRTRTRVQAQITIAHARENSEIVLSFYKGKKFPLLVDSREIKSMDREARKHFSTNGRETSINAMAVMVSSPLSRVIGNFFLGLNKPQIPARLFDKEPEAIAWLKTFL